MRPATPAVMGKNLAAPRGKRRCSQGKTSNRSLITAASNGVQPVYRPVLRKPGINGSAHFRLSRQEHCQ